MPNTSKGYDSDDEVEVVCIVKARTSKAWLLNDGKTEAWVPTSQIISHKTAHTQGNMEVVVPYWIAHDKGFI